MIKSVFKVYTAMQFSQGRQNRQNRSPQKKSFAKNFKKALTNSSFDVRI